MLLVKWRWLHLARGVVDSEVEEEASAAGDGEPGGEGEALELEGRDGVEAADREAKGIQAEDER